MMRVVAIPGLDADAYQRHCLHGDEAVWVEKNCYGDIWIEVLHALGLEPLAVLPFTLAVDFEGDQWTFFKPPHGELYDLYGVDVQELTVWRPLIEHAIEHLGAGKLISTEADAFWLPDTAGTDYRSTHTKSTIVLADLDVEARRLGYFHNAGYFRLEGEDFIKTFRLDAPHDPSFLPLFAEVIRTDRIKRRSDAELAACAWPLLRRHFERRPLTNPLRRFGERFISELPDLQARGLAYYHAWGFATIRQAGAAFDLAAAHLRWQAGHGHPELLPAAEGFGLIAQGNKALILKAARAVNAKRPFDAAPLFDDMAQAWDRAMASLAQAL
ncbi:MAG TPA: DUF1839 family protein [Rhizobacter sp.]|nr:DUF1839 family protein [Rhizobacter sp.]